MWKELCGQSGWGWDNEKGVPTASEEVMQTYFKAVPEAQKFRNAPPDFLPLLEELFEGVLASGEHVISIQEVIDSYIDPELLRLSEAATSQVTDPADEEDEREDEEVEESVEPNLFESQRS